MGKIHSVDSNVAVVRSSHHAGPALRFAGTQSATTMFGVFAAVALLLAAVGVYGVMSYPVSQSTHDIGVRIALGARPATILGLVVRQGMELAAIGVVAGLIGALALTRAMASLLFGVTATDAVTFIAVALILGTGRSLLNRQSQSSPSNA